MKLLLVEQTGLLRFLHRWAILNAKSKGDDDTELQFIKADPSGNTTILVLTPVPRQDYAAVAQRVMDAVSAEQVAFVQDGRMEMMGGEFCGNASRSFAAWKAMADPTGLALHDFPGEKRLTVSVSGTPTPLSAAVRSLGGPDRCECSMDMPLPLYLCDGVDSALGAYTLAAFDGISHLVLAGRTPRSGDADSARRLLTSLKADAGCFGLLYYNEGALRPRVYVQATDTLIWESSCGSGSCAVAAALARQRRESVRLTLPQPGGTLSVDARWEDGLRSLTLDGVIRFVASGTLYL